MAYQVASNAIHYIGTSNDLKPKSAPFGSTLFEANTGNNYIWDGSVWWMRQSTSDGLMNGLLKDLLIETKLLRRGLIDSVNCAEVDIRDVDN